jgi:hypothetical protein
MSAKSESRVNLTATVVGLIIAVFGAVQAFALLPYKVERNQENIKVLEAEMRENREILVRIDERTKFMEESFKRMEERRLAQGPK